jgi:hypothetical protein
MEEPDKTKGKQVQEYDVPGHDQLSKILILWKKRFMRKDTLG